ncbi:MAG: DUF3302 domain-containing protein [Planctomycetaceae bacterium]|nr:DUF3302 domain-containing protein [Planctomycetaceae bacterium]
MLDVMTLAIILIVLVVNVFFLLWMASLPGHIAKERSHPQAEAIACCGWLSLVTFFATWPIAMVWAFTQPLHVAVTSQDSPAGTNPSRMA